MKNLRAAQDLAAMLRVGLEDIRANLTKVQNARAQPDQLIRATREFSVQLVNSRRFQISCATLLRRLGFDLANVVMDRPRFRCTPPSSETAILDPFVYGAHRDTWFSEPEAQVNIWMSPYDVLPNQTFVFFPEYFARAIGNSSSTFDLRSEIQRRSGAHPAPDTHIQGSKVGFSAEAGDAIIFSASQLHQTIRNSSGVPRYALQLRVVDLRDVDGQAKALRIDNLSSGSTLQEMQTLDTWINSGQ